GTQAMIGALRQAGFRCGVISSGVAQVVEPLLDGLGLDFAAANRLEVSAGRLTGRLVGGQLDRPGRAGALVRFAQGCGVPLGQTVAVGGGTGDVDLVRGAGLGIAIGTEPERGRGGEGGARSARGTEPRYAHTL